MIKNCSFCGLDYEISELGFICEMCWREETKNHCPACIEKLKLEREKAKCVCPRCSLEFVARPLSEKEG